ncbi:MAG TPA: GNAT family N-acetyltransferase [candidate division Zixibacteria bacterium]|nr:GNAT family N-acetyltransferase [candidate division Zixibacteria bacterium]
MTAVRGARPEDAEVLADLTTQLGYPGTAEELRNRLQALMAVDAGAVFVAVDERDRPVGWVHVEVQHHLTSERTGLVAGLVVDERARGRGIGLDLLRRAEEWALQRGCRTMRVASRVTRERAHRFYLREGYTLLKTSHVFEKPLAG